MKNIKRLTAWALLLVMLIASVLPIAAAYEPRAAVLVYSTSSNSGTRHVVCTTLQGTSADSYYTGQYEYDTLSEQSSTQIYNSLNTLMTSTHKKNSTYNDCRDMANETDCEENNGLVTLIYSSYQVEQSQSGSSGAVWNREHVWPKSLGNFNTSGPGADLHQIRPSDARLNTIRNNNKYGNVSGGSAATGSDLVNGMVGGYYGGGYFEPLDNVKGDVARICLYMYVRYGKSSSYSCNKITNVFQSVEVLLEWCELDPVDTWEMGRNEVVAAYQGNRNVFIDYPEYAWLIFGEDVPTDMTTPSGKAACGSGSGPITPECQHTNTVIRNEVQENCGDSGYTGDTYCEDCNEKLSSGTTIPATGDHSFGSWTIVGDHQERKCSVCEEVETQPLPDCEHKNTTIRNESQENCGEDGYTGDTYCTDCNTKLSSGNVIPATGDHSFGAWVTVGDHQERKCSVCKEVETQPIPDCKHKNTTIRNEIQETCGEDGYTGDIYCTDCGNKVESGHKIPATGKHGQTEVRNTLAPTCALEGYTGDTYCKDCGKKTADGNSIPTTDDHKNEELRGSKDATCSEAGYTGDTYCKDCERLISNGSSIPATGKHAFDEGTVIIEPTETTEGLKSETCTSCGLSQGVSIPALGSTDKPAEPTDPIDGNDKDNDNTVIIIAVVAASVIVLGAGAAAVTFAVKKKK